MKPFTFSVDDEDIDVIAASTAAIARNAVSRSAIVAAGDAARRCGRRQSAHLLRRALSPAAAPSGHVVRHVLLTSGTLLSRKSLFLLSSAV